MLHAAYADFLMDVFGDSEAAAAAYAQAAAMVTGRAQADVLVCLRGWGGVVGGGGGGCFLQQWGGHCSCSHRVCSR
jgi:hypothetical protein